MSIRNRHRILSMALAAAALVFTGTLTGCAGFWQPITSTTNGSSGNGSGDYVFVGKNGQAGFAGYSMSNSGLTAITGSPFTLPSAPQAMAVTQNDNYLYIATVNGIYGYSIGTGGVLTALNAGGVVGGTPTSFSPVAMAITPDSGWLIVMNNISAANFYFYQIASGTGLLSATPSQEGYAPGSNGTPVANSLQFSPITSVVNGNTQYVFAATFGSGGEGVYTFAPSATNPIVQAQGCIPPSAADSDNGIAFNSNGTSFTVVRGGAASELISYTIDVTSGSFACGEPVGIAATGATPTAISFSNSTTQPYIYVTNTGTSTISGYTVTSSTTTPVTTFTAFGSSAVSTLGNSPYAIAFDNMDLYMVALNQFGPADLVLYTVQPSSSATPGVLSVTGTVTTNLAVQTGTVGSAVAMAVTH